MFVAIALAHAAVIALLLRALIKSGVIANPAAITMSKISEAATMPLPAAEPIPVTADVAPPRFKVKVDEQVPAVTTDSNNDPFGGAAIAPAPAAAVALPARYQGADLTSDNATSTVEAEDTEWLVAIRQRLQGRRATSGGPLAPVVVQVLARPKGGFSDVRLKSSTGAIDVDQQLLAAVMLQQSLVPPRMVGMMTWISLSPILLASS